MSSSRRHTVRTAASVFAILLLSVASFAKGSAGGAFPNVRIKNFGQMDERFYRGAEPRDIEDFRALKELGISTIIDLQAKPERTERGMVESLGMRYVNIPMIEKKYPRPEWVAAFMQMVDDPTTGKFYVHCAGGRHRTGALGAVYRMEKYGWGYDQVYAEMKQFDFYTTWGHGGFKTFVQDYARQMQERQKAAPSVPAAQVGSAEAVFAGKN